MTCVTTFKAKCDGFADDTQALKDAVKYAREAGDEITIPPGSTVKHCDIWDIGDGDASGPSATQSIRIRGGIPSGEMTPAKHAVRLVYDGPSGSPCQVRVNGPIIPEISGLALDGNFKAGGLHAMHPVGGKFERLHSFNWMGEAFKQEALPSPQNCTAGSARNEWKHFATSLPGDPEGVAFTLGQAAITYGEMDPARNTFEHFNLRTGNSPTSVGLRLAGCDIAQFRSGQIVHGVPAAQALGKTVQIKPSLDFPHLPSECSFDSVCTAGPWDVPSVSEWNPTRGRGIRCDPFLTGDVETMPGYLPAHPAIWGFTSEGHYFRNGVIWRPSGTPWRDHTPLAATNTSALTPLASFDIRGGTLGVDGSLPINASGFYYNGTGASTTLLVQIAYGGVPIFSWGPFTVPAAAGVRAFSLWGAIKAKNAGGQSCHWMGGLGASASVGPNAALTPYVFNQGYQTSVDATLTQPLTFQVQHGAASPDIRFELKDFDVELHQ